eukprot:13346418-Alexandrium_andersonii.AAC.1
MSGDYRREVRSSWWFACQPGMDLSASAHFHYLPVPVRREVARLGVLPGLRHAASLMQRIDVVMRRHDGLAPF